MKVHCIQHSGRVRPVNVAPWAAERGHELVVVRVDLGEPLPDPADITALVVLGGEMNTDEADRHPWLDVEREWLTRVVAAPHVRIVGICLGSQLLAEVLGGSVARAPAREVGWHSMELTPAAQQVETLAALPQRFDVMQWHGDAWTLPPGAELVVTGAPGSGTCATQAFAWDGGRVVGVQFHPEFSNDQVSANSATTTDDLTTGGLVQTREAMIADPARFERMRREVLAPLLDGVLAGRAT